MYMDGLMPNGNNVSALYLRFFHPPPGWFTDRRTGSWRDRIALRCMIFVHRGYGWWRPINSPLLASVVTFISLG